MIHQTAKINVIILWAVDIIRIAYYIDGSWCVLLFYTLNDGPYTLL